jgi:hypothetical protein
VANGINCTGHQKRSYFTVNTKKLMFCSRIFAIYFEKNIYINPLNAELNPMCQLQILLVAHPVLHISRTRVKLTNVPCGVCGVFLYININGACDTVF